MLDALGWRMKFGVIATSANIVAQPAWWARRCTGFNDRTDSFGASPRDC